MFDLSIADYRMLARAKQCTPRCPAPEFPSKEWYLNPMHSRFATAHLAEEAVCVETLLSALDWDSERSRRVELHAKRFVRRIRDRSGESGRSRSGPTEIEAFLQQYPLDSPEGLALMTLAEALLRIPDSDTADALIAEKIMAGTWNAKGRTSLTRLASMGMSLARRILSSSPGDLERALIRKSVKEAVRRVGQQFVIGENMAGALTAARKLEQRGYRMSFDMLGEGARTAADAQRYFEAYAAAGDALRETENPSLKPSMSVSVKLSALHPRYTWTQRDRCVPELIGRLSLLCRRAAASGIGLTVDAEEADRLEISWEIISAVARLPELHGWNGFGLAIQAYDKRCFYLIDAIDALAAESGRKIRVRLVKGAYWDTEIKRAQVGGLQDYPVFTRKANTDLSYLACARKLLALRDRIYPMFGTHNAHTVAAVLDMAEETEGFEFQRLYGMGEALHDLVLSGRLAPVSIYAPVGSHEELLPYLVRRMLENGANTSFVNQVREDEGEAALKDPVETAAKANPRHNPRIVLPQDLYEPRRKNSAGIDLSAEIARDAFQARIPPAGAWRDTIVTPLIDGVPRGTGHIRRHAGPASTGGTIAAIRDATADDIKAAFETALRGYREWRNVSATERAAVLRRAAERIELSMPTLIGLLQQEGGKTLPDAISEVREAMDFCRYYAAEGEHLFRENGILLPGPTGEENRLIMEARGIFVCISPWNFPLAIFMGQIAAALMAGNSVIAKPAEQTPVIAYAAVRLLLDAGVPPSAVSLLPGDGRTGAALVAHAGVNGVAFTGSVEVAHRINRMLAEKEEGIVPFIAETGGLNAMLVDSTALPEQVIDDVMLSAFGSAGQRCSALRVLYVQEEIADRVISLLRGALQELRIGDPHLASIDVGPVIDADALAALASHVRYLRECGALIGEATLPEGLPGWYIAPAAYEIGSIDQLPGEVFGPVLHLIRYATKDRDRIIRDINATGYGLTFGIHSRLRRRAAETACMIRAGNVYINRSMIGAAVGVQPFGGRGLSGTGPKAGGPHYLVRFADEKTITDNMTATGGNVFLLSTPQG